MSALLAALAGTFVATSIVLIGGASVLRPDRQVRKAPRRDRRRL